MKKKKIIIILLIPLIIIIALTFYLKKDNNRSKKQIDNKKTNLKVPTDEQTIFKFDSKTGTILGFKEDISDYPKNLIIPNEISGVKVEIIGEEAFFSKELETVKLPKYLKRIEQGAFSGNDKEMSIDKTTNHLKEITIPKGVEYIGKYSFQYNELEKINLPNSLNTIDDAAFWGNNNLKQLNLPTNLKKIGDNVFAYNDLETIIIPKNVEEIGSSAFLHNETSNPNFSEIINKTNKSFAWDKIVSTKTKSKFKTGTIKSPFGNIIVTSK